jgi:hypothetical protein
MFRKVNYYLFKEANIEYLQIFFISFFFALLAGSGFYGFGVDFYSAYSQPNIFRGGYTDRLGWILSTLTIFKTHVGVYLVSFLLAISTGLLLVKTTYRYFDKNKLVFFTCYIMLLHTWPIIMSTSNAMRQGIAMSFLFLALYFLLSKRYFLYLASIGLVAISHNSGMLLVLLLAGFTIYNSQAKKWFNSPNNYRKLLVITGFLMAVILYILVPLILNNHEDSRIIAGDYRYPFLVINTAYILIYIKYLFIKADHIDIFLLICSFIFPVFLFHGFNWEYERLNMIILILYMVSFSKIFLNLGKKNTLLFPASLLFSTMLLLFMTFYTGMYSLGLN